MWNAARITVIKSGEMGNVGQLHNDAAGITPVGTGLLKRFAGGCKRIVALRLKISTATAAAQDDAAMG